MNCWKCGKATGYEIKDKIPFRAECQYCRSALHACCNCRYYKPGLSNDCRVPNTDYVSDRTASNLCEEYRHLEVFPTKPISPTESKKKFNDLFRDD